MKISELSIAELDAMFACAEGFEILALPGQPDSWCAAKNGISRGIIRGGKPMDWLKYGSYRPTKNWSITGPVIEREDIIVWRYEILSLDDIDAGKPQNFAAKIRGALEPQALAPTYLSAAVQCYLLKKFGPDIDLGSI